MVDKMLYGSLSIMLVFNLLMPIPTKLTLHPKCDKICLIVNSSREVEGPAR